MQDSVCLTGLDQDEQTQGSWTDGTSLYLCSGTGAQAGPSTHLSFGYFALPQQTRVCVTYIPQRVKFSAWPFIKKFADLYFEISRWGHMLVAWHRWLNPPFQLMGELCFVPCSCLSFSSVVQDRSSPALYWTNLFGLRRSLLSSLPGEISVELRAGVNDDGSEVNTWEPCLTCQLGFFSDTGCK